MGEGGGGTSNNVYVLDKQYAWVPAVLVETQGEKAKVSIAEYPDEGSILSDNGKTATGWREETVSLKYYPGKNLPPQNVDNDGNLIEKEDMVDLPYLHEAGILYNMKARHVQAKPYTRTGDIVIAVNPYEWLTHILTDEVQQEYANKLIWKVTAEGDPRKTVQPHVYETSSLCYKGLARDCMNQSILVSGESGAGKTETVKICMSHIACVQRGLITADTPKDEGSERVVQRVVDSNPLLEAFGNAKTRRNDNSSRFGKYIQLQFDRDEKATPGTIPRCRLAGSKIDVYLLEKSRIVEHDPKERTYHVFYAIIGAKDEDKAKIWKGLVGTNTKSFKYVGHSDTTSWDKMEDGDHFYDTSKNLGVVHIEGEKLLTLWRAITCTLQLGNVTFGEDEEDEEKSCVTSKESFEGLADLIGIDPAELELSLTERTMTTRGEVFKVPLKKDGAKDSADAFAKEIYAKVFLWLVREINGCTSAEDNYDGERKTGFGSIGLLDIFGFESFPVNGFEQLAINYANEKLQQKFTRDIFQTVQEEYKFEGIDLADITYDDNSDVLDLIESRGGLLSLLNEECMRPKGSDKDFVSKATKANSKSKCLIADKLLGPLDFGIHHYAGKVVYFAQGWLGRNMDSMAPDLIAIAKKSTNDIIANHLQNESMMKTENKGPAVNKEAPRRGKSNIASDTLMTKFKSSINALMKNLNETQSRYVRCVKPNTLKKPRVMQHMTTIEQLRSAGVVAAVTISRSAFPNRLDHRGSVERFKVLQEKGQKREEGAQIDYKEECEKLMTYAFKDYTSKEYKVVFTCGKTRVYYRMGALEYLEAERVKAFDIWVVDIQKVVRGHLARRKNKLLGESKKEPKAILIQKIWRGCLAKKELKALKKAKKEEKKMKKKGEKKKHKAAMKIQSVVRMHQQKPRFAELLKASREKDSLKNTIKDLETRVREAESQRLKEVEAAREAAESEMEAYRTKVKAELANDKEKQKKSAQQQSLIEESGKIIEYLRKENMKLRNQNEAMRKDFKSLKENNQRLMEANASAGQSFTALNDHAKQLNQTNSKLIKNVEAYKAQLEKLKDDLKTRQAYYLAEAEARLAYQKTMAQIVGAIQDKCRDAQLTEDVVIMALECEAEAKAERAALEAASSKAKAKKEEKAPPPKKAAPPPDDSDDDDDSD